VSSSLGYLIVLFVFLDVGFNFSSRLAWTGGPPIDAAARGPTPSLTIEIISGSLPPGVRWAQVATQTGAYQAPQLVGVPTQVGTFTVGLKVTDYLGGLAMTTYTVSVVNPPSLDVSALSVIGEVGVPFSGSLSQTGGGASRYWLSTTSSGGEATVGSATLLPFGVVISNRLNESSKLGGTPAQNGTYELTFFAQSYYLANSSLPVVTGNPILHTVPVTIYSKLFMQESRSQVVTIGIPFELALEATGGVPNSLQFVVVGTLPAGVKLDAKSGVISGALLSSSQAGAVYTFSVVAKDGLNATTSTGITLRSVDAPTISGLSTGGIVGVALGATVAVILCGIFVYIIHRKWASGEFHAPLDEGSSDSMYFKF
jgi:hypothetical protein